MDIVYLEFTIDLLWMNDTCNFQFGSKSTAKRIYGYSIYVCIDDRGCVCLINHCICAVYMVKFQRVFPSFDFEYFLFTWELYEFPLLNSLR